VGTIYVPEPAQRAVLNKPRRLGDDLMFRTKRGRQFRQESLHRAWTPVRAAFMAQLPAGHPCISALPSTMRTEGLLRAPALRRSYMLNVLELEPWVIAEQLRHSDAGVLVVKLYGHPSREAAIERMRRAYTRAWSPFEGSHHLSRPLLRGKSGDREE
jgi:hypothetical protein